MKTCATLSSATKTIKTNKTRSRNSCLQVVRQSKSKATPDPPTPRPSTRPLVIEKRFVLCLALPFLLASLCWVVIGHARVAITRERSLVCDQAKSPYPQDSTGPAGSLADCRSCARSLEQTRSLSFVSCGLCCARAVLCSAVLS